MKEAEEGVDKQKIVDRSLESHKTYTLMNTVPLNDPNLKVNVLWFAEEDLPQLTKRGAPSKKNSKKGDGYGAQTMSSPLKM